MSIQPGQINELHLDSILTGPLRDSVNEIEGARKKALFWAVLMSTLLAASIAFWLLIFLGLDPANTLGIKWRSLMDAVGGFLWIIAIAPLFLLLAVIIVVAHYKDRYREKILGPVVEKLFRNLAYDAKGNLKMSIIMSFIPKADIATSKGVFRSALDGPTSFEISEVFVQGAEFTYTHRSNSGRTSTSKHRHTLFEGTVAVLNSRWTHPKNFYIGPKKNQWIFGKLFKPVFESRGGTWTDLSSSNADFEKHFVTRADSPGSTHVRVSESLQQELLLWRESLKITPEFLFEGKRVLIFIQNCALHSPSIFRSVLSAANLAEDLRTLRMLLDRLDGLERELDQKRFVA